MEYSGGKAGIAGPCLHPGYGQWYQLRIDSVILFAAHQRLTIYEGEAVLG